MKNPYLKVQTLELKTQVETASPHGLIDLLLQGARSNIAKAQGNIQRKQIKEKGEHIGKALGIVEGLKTSLNPEKGGEITVNLKQLYEHIQESLLQANRNNDEALLAHANGLLAEIHEAWQGIR